MQTRGRVMIGAIAGDIIGSVYERHNIRHTDFPLFDPQCTFTDDTVLTVAVAHSILTQEPYDRSLKRYFSYYPYAGYGALFRKWAGHQHSKPYQSFGNGSAMRVSPVGYAFDTLQEVLHEAEKSAAVSHSHPEGIKGAQATAAAVFLARTGKEKQDIKRYIESTFHYSLSSSYDELSRHYTRSITCQGTVPQAITVFLESGHYEDAIRKSIAIGGDSDTIACITGGIAQAFYKDIPDYIEKKVFEILDTRLKQVVYEFTEKYPC